ncbi:Hypothetical Protein FCC1311_073702 [Hondaea fermentalgiana]|uniref:Uncharacterized protein n=1 Tax=Hondaea fermentalgiana TaxID=2315210 RepID=A0A2R5GLG0_9STRA|nr:Hypothetical Protein FCC1311_073702 [Hondaea fermentalgiana]|eukprot:GBG31149.1 Hypothetical Protein FCC1311_073702 [Hondaea fermentalgiana]
MAATNSNARYFKVDNLTRQQEQAHLKANRQVRNFGRLDETKIEELASGSLDHSEDPNQLLKKRRPWRLQRFLAELIQTEGVVFGTKSYAGYKLRVLNGGVETVLGRDSHGSLGHLLQTAVHQLNGREAAWWEDFRLWKSLLGTSLINLLPDRPFALYIYSKDPVGDDVPIYYMELEINGDTDRHVLLWELDQVMTEANRFARPHEGSRASEYCSAYQKVYFYMNWEENAPRRVVRAVVSDLPKHEKEVWDDWLAERHEDHWFDAVIAIIVIALSTLLSFSQVLNQPVISLIAGVVVAGIASEEWMPPQTVLLGAIARFYANESLSLRMYYRTDYSLSIKSVLISLLASIAEVSDIFVGEDPACMLPSNCTVNATECEAYLQTNNNTASGLVDYFDTAFEPTPCNCCSFNNQDFLLAIAALINISLLLHTAFSGVYGSFSHSDFPAQTSYFPKIYVEKTGYFRQLVMDCRPVEEFCSVYRPLLHWQRGVQNRFLGDAVDLSAPGSPPSMMCYWLSSPASALMAQKYLVYGIVDIPVFLLPLAIVEQAFALLGGLLTILFDIPVTLALFLVLCVKKTGLIPRSLVRVMVAACMHIYDPIQLMLYVLDAYNGLVAVALHLDTLECRGRSTARLFRWALIQSVRTGRSSNHSWKFGDHIYDDGYYRCSDCIIVNPRTPKLGMIEANKLFYKRHKLLWTTTNGVRYVNPCLSCGDNTVSRRSSLIRQVSHQSMLNPDDIPDVELEHEEDDNDDNDDRDSRFDEDGDAGLYGTGGNFVSAVDAFTDYSTRKQ